MLHPCVDVQCSIALYMSQVPTFGTYALLYSAVKIVNNFLKKNLGKILCINGNLYINYKIVLLRISFSSYYFVQHFATYLLHWNVSVILGNEYASLKLVRMILIQVSPIPIKKKQKLIVEGFIGKIFTIRNFRYVRVIYKRCWNEHKFLFNSSSDKLIQNV